MDLQMVLSATQESNLRDMLYPGNPGTGPNYPLGEDRFTEYLRKALGNESTFSPVNTECSDTHQNMYSGETAAQSGGSKENGTGKVADQAYEKGAGSAESETLGVEEAVANNSERDRVSSKDKTGKGQDESPFEAALSDEITEASDKEGLKKPGVPAKQAESGKESGKEKSKAEGKTAVRLIEQEAAAIHADSAEGKSREASAVQLRGKGETGRAGADALENGRTAEAQAPRKAVLDTEGQNSGGTGAKNGHGHREPILTVVDLRKSRGKDGTKNRDVRAERAGSDPSGSGKEAFRSAVDRAVSGEERTTDTAVKILRPDGEPAVGRENAPRSEAKQNFSQEQNSLFRNMRDSGNGEIVKRAGIILKDNSSGEIRMELKPEKLGKVRVQIHVKDNTLSGKIIVESSAVREVFESNMEALNRAFKESGFDTAELDVQVGGGKQQEHQGSQKQRPRTAENIRSLEEHVSLSRDGGYSDSVIDLVV